MHTVQCYSSTLSIKVIVYIVYICTDFTRIYPNNPTQTLEKVIVYVVYMCSLEEVYSIKKSVKGQRTHSKLN